MRFLATWTRMSRSKHATLHGVSLFLLLLCGCHGTRPVVAVDGDCARWCRAEIPGTAGVSFRDIWGDGDHVWIVGQGGILVHGDGREWLTERVSTHDLNAVTGDGHVVAVGDGGTVLEWVDGKVRASGAGEYSRYRFTGVASGAGGFWIIGGSTDGSPPEALVLRLEAGRLRTAWQPAEPGRAPFLTGVCATEAGRVIAVGGVGREPEPLLLSGNQGFEPLSLETAALPGACVGRGETVAVIDRDGLNVAILRGDGISRVGANCGDGLCEPPFQETSSPTMWLSDEHSGIAVADAIVMFRDDGYYRSVASPGVLLDVHGAAPDDVFAVGESGLVMRFDGNRWRTLRNSGATLRAVWAWPGGVVAAGDGGTILVYNDKRIQ